MMIYLKNMAGHKMGYFKGISYDKIRPMFEKEYNKIQTLFKKDTEVEKTKTKRVAEETLLQESFKKLRTAEASSSEPIQEQPIEEPKELSEEELKKMLEIVPVEEIKAEALQVKKGLSIVNYSYGFDAKQKAASRRRLKDIFNFCPLNEPTSSSSRLSDKCFLTSGLSRMIDLLAKFGYWVIFKTESWNHDDLLSSVSYRDGPKWALPLARRNYTDSIVEVGTTLFASNKDNHDDLLSSVSYRDRPKWALPLARRNCTDSIVEVGTTLFASNKDVLRLQV
ncbi:hypothetical protein Tco_1136326 [Tanacetum coccineum]